MDPLNQPVPPEATTSAGVEVKRIEKIAERTPRRQGGDAHADTIHSFTALSEREEVR
jgi:hypothetical protein